MMWMQRATFNTKKFPTRSSFINPKSYRRPEHMARTKRSQAWSKGNPTSHLGWKPHANIFIRSYASSLPRASLCFRIWELCSSLSVVMYSFCVLSTRSKLRTKSWSVFFSSSPFDLSSLSFDPSVVDEQFASFLSTLAMGTSFVSIAVFPEFASLGAFPSCLIISAFALDKSFTFISPFDSSNFNFPRLIRSWTLYLSAL